MYAVTRTSLIYVVYLDTLRTFVIHESEESVLLPLLSALISVDSSATVDITASVVVT